MAAGPRIDDEAERRAVLGQVSVEKFLYELEEILEDYPDADELVLEDAATPDLDMETAGSDRLVPRIRPNWIQIECNNHYNRSKQRRSA